MKNEARNGRRTAAVGKLKRKVVGSGALVQPPGKPRLYEITALVTYSVVVLATSREDAEKHVETWEQCWPTSSDLIGVSDVDMTDVRALKARDWKDEAHEATPAALSSLNVEISHANPNTKPALSGQ